MAIVLSVLRLTRLLVTLLVSFCHCIVCPSTYTGLLVTLLVSFGHCIVCPSTYTASGYPFGIFCPLYCLSFDLHGASGYPFGIFWPLYCLSFDLHGFWLPFWYLVAIVLSVLLLTRLLITLLVSFGHCIVCPSTYTASGYPFGIFWPLYCLSFDLHGFWLPFWYLLAIVLSVLRLTRSFWLPFWYLLAIVLSVLRIKRLLITLLVSSDFWPLYCLSFDLHGASGYPFGIFWPLYCLSFDLNGF